MWACMVDMCTCMSVCIQCVWYACACISVRSVLSCPGHLCSPWSGCRTPLHSALLSQVPPSHPDHCLSWVLFHRHVSPPVSLITTSLRTGEGRNSQENSMFQVQMLFPAGWHLPTFLARAPKQAVSVPSAPTSPLTADTVGLGDIFSQQPLCDIITGAHGS